METIPELLERFPDAHLVLAGEGDRLSEFRALAAPWSERVHLPGIVLHDALADLYRAADLFVLPAIHDAQGNVDGLPNVILEAMASGLPVVASRISGIPLAVEDADHGLLVEEGRPAELSAALSRLLADSSLRRRLGLAARTRATSELTWDAIAARFETSYLAMLQPRSDGSSRPPTEEVG